MQRQLVWRLLSPLAPFEVTNLLIKADNKVPQIWPLVGDKHREKWVPGSYLSTPLCQKRDFIRRDNLYGHFNNFRAYRRLQFSTCVVSESEEAGGIIEVPLAQTGEGIADCELLAWLVKEGDEVDEFQPLCSVQSDKATIQITSRYKGRVSRLNFVAGDIIKVGESLLELIASSIANTCSKEESPTEDPSNELDGEVVESSRKALATPAVRHLARDHGVKVEDVLGSGKDGRVLKQDVVEYVTTKSGLNEELTTILSISPKDEHAEATPLYEAKQSARPNAPQPAEMEDKVFHVRGYQRAMVKAMTAAAVIPHFYLVDELNLDALVKLKKNLKESYTEHGVKLTYLPLMIKALSVALLKYPLMNSTYDEAACTICCRGSHNVGVAIATPHGLAVPNIKNVERLSVLEIVKELARLTHLASSNGLSTDDISGGTITVSNFGSIGGKVGFPLLNTPEVAIGAFGRIYTAPCYVQNGTVVYPAALMNVTWAGDHRVLDGATLANFCNEWKSLIEQPERLVLQLR